MNQETPEAPDRSATGRIPLKLSAVPRSVRTWAPTVTVYSLLLGLLYQRTYWIGFDVNAMYYMGLEDVVRASVAPLAIAGFGALCIAAISIWFQSKAARAGSNAPTILPPLWLRITATVAMFVSAIGILLFILWNPTTLFYFLGTVAIASLFVLVNQSDFFVHVSPIAARPLIVSGILIAPFFTWVYARARVEEVKSGLAFNLATLPTSVLSEIPDVGAETRLSYLGHINDYDFFRADKRTIVIRSQALPAFSYEHHDKRRLRIPFWDPLTSSSP
jgi:hypothetical protein